MPGDVAGVSKLILWSAALLFLPGYALGGLILRKERFSFLESVPVYFALSLAVLTAPGLAGYIFHFRISEFAALAAFASLILLVFSLRLRGRKAPNGHVSDQRAGNRFIFGIMCTASAAVAILMFAYQGSLNTDGLNFVAFVRKLAVNEVIDNVDAFYMGISVDPTYGYNIWTLVLALLSVLPGCDPVVTWVVVGAVLSPVIILSLYSCARTVFEDEFKAVASALVLIFCYVAVEEMWIFRTACYYMVVTNFILLPIAWKFMFLYVRRGDAKSLVVSASLGMVIAAVHLFGYAVFVLSLLAFGIFHFLFLRPQKGAGRRILAVLVLTCAVASPYIALRAPYMEVTNYGYSHALEAVRFGDDIAYGSPKRLLAAHYHVMPPHVPRMIYLAAYAAAVFLLMPSNRKKDSSVFLLGNMLGPPLVILNPLIVPYLVKMVPYDLVIRTSQLSPVFLVLGSFAGEVPGYLGRLTGSNLLSRPGVRAILLLALLGLLFLFPRPNDSLTGFIRRVKPGVKSPWQVEFVRNPYLAGYFDRPQKFLPMLRYFHNRPDSRGVILSDEEASLFLSAYSNCHVAVTHSAHASPAAGDQRQREADAEKVLHLGDMEDVKRILGKYNVDYVVISADFVDSFRNRAALAGLKEFGGLLKTVCDKDDFLVLEVAGP